MVTLSFPQSKDVSLKHYPLSKDVIRIKRALCSEEHAQTVFIDMLGEQILVDLGLRFVDGKALEVKKQLDAKRRKKLINSRLNKTNNVGQSSAQDVEVEVITPSAPTDPQPFIRQYDHVFVPSWVIRTEDNIIDDSTIATDFY
ncbi:hypothetical protein Syun_006846 [Stephania yunnanensis]|uniref:Uncharacterized protein n=1 Tax=Stephania yunnanensis TaxID=152371 RepID=A0AAP0KYD6_9MAGN